MTQVKSKKWRKTPHAYANPKKAGVAVLFSDKAEFGAGKLMRKKEGHHTLTKGSLLQEDIKTRSVYGPYNRASRDERQTRAKLWEGTGKPSLCYSWRLQHASLSDQSIEQVKINKDTVVLHSVIDQPDLADT